MFTWEEAMMASRRQAAVVVAALLAVFATACRAEPPSTPQPAGTPQPGVAVGIVFDTSGSMAQSVANAQGKQTPKYVIASDSLQAIINKLDRFQRSGSDAAPHKLEVGLYIFQGQNAVESVPFGPFDANKLRRWLSGYNRPSGSTPLGQAVRMASDAVLKSRMESKHVLVITDGKNTAGPDPSSEMQTVQALASKQGATLFHHFIAFDIDAKEFEAAKKQGATVLGAANEQELNSQLDFILEEKILLEKE
jgi:hypothetical protein